jgi:hypothetical protein
MGKIYTFASSVLIFIGSDNGGLGESAASLATELSRMIVDKCVVARSEPDGFPYPSPDDPFLADSRWESLIELQHQPWFTRGWVVQEAVLAQDARILWGNVEFKYLDLMRSILWIIRRGRGGRASLMGNITTSTRFHIEAIKARYKSELQPLISSKEPPVQKFYKTLHNARGLELTDARDRIHAFLGLTPSAESHGSFKADYTCSALEVYRKFACEYLVPNDGVEFLHVTQPSQSGQSLSFPSWIPQWQNGELQTPLATLCGIDMGPPASLITPPAVVDGDRLKLRGFLMDTVAIVSETLDQSTTLSQLANLYLKVAALNGPSSPYLESYRPLAFLQAVGTPAIPTGEEIWRNHSAAYLLKFLRLTNEADSLDESSDILERASRGDAGILLRVARKFMDNRQFFITQRSYYGLAPAGTEPGDSFIVIKGARTPFILRAQGVGAPTGYQYIGECHVVGTVLAPGSNQWLTALGTEEEWPEWAPQEQDIYLI